MDTKPLTVEAPTWPQLAKLIEERVHATATERGVGTDVVQSALGFSGTGLENDIVSLIVKFHNAAMFGEQIKAGNFDYRWGVADRPEQIEGQVAHAATGDTELDHPGKTLTTKQVWERYGDGDLSELLDYALKHPNDQREALIGIVWKVGDQFWFAFLDGYGSRRRLDVRRDRPGGQWDDNDRFLRGKSAVAKA